MTTYVKRRPMAALAASCAIVLGMIVFDSSNGRAAAQDLFQPATAADTAAASRVATSKDPQAKRERLVRVDTTVLSRHLVPAGADKAADRERRAERLDGVVSLQLFPDATETFKRTAVSAEPSGGYVWEGANADKPVHEALLLINNGTISGRIQLQDRLFRIEPVSGQVHRITELDPAKFPPELPPLTLPPGSLPKAEYVPKDEGIEETDAKANTIVRVLVAYTLNARTQAGGATKMLKEINRAVALANQAYKRAGIKLVLQLAGTPIAVKYAEKPDMANDLYNLSNLGSPVASQAAIFQPIRNKRVQVKADVVSLFRATNATNCGIAWFPDVTSPFETMPTPGPSTRVTGYSVMARNCVENLSFHHEIGHNMGLRHDRFVDGSPGGYNFGFVNLPKRTRTIMAYQNACGSTPCTRINWFSSATIRATGNVVIGNGTNDNTRRLKQTYTAVSKYY